MLNFNLLAIKAYSSALVEVADWQQWAATSFQPLPASNKFKASKIPMMQARRMGLSDKMAIQLAMELLELQPDIDAVVFASRHGQLERTYKLLSRFFATGDMSPTDFATAVHNAPAGQFSILAKNTAPISSIAAEEQSFCTGLLEALLALQGGKRKVLYVMFDGVVPEFYHPFLQPTELSEPYALGMVLEQGEQWQLSWQPPSQQQAQKFPDGLSFLHKFFQNQPHFYLESDTQRWLFTQN
ncbi:beta-ketoacyl synthase chain length factor [Gallibacterium salpingitidis]|uniref:beta-ketoacyl synthase chain length factor n=1 Tax=Gallibacterium salpingitidis TaxID=505341 RepID=UPI000824F7FE|nr:beta-ketoacyl synthase chain length factor [Gallibacterium salpingitidis]WKS99401.1 beta-ketoacyl synthase chain length factor [Gallibacterium salpingitidis]